MIGYQTAEHRNGTRYERTACLKSNHGPQAIAALARLSAIALLLGTIGTATAAGSAQSYPDGHGGEVRFPQGDVSFADTVEHYNSGDPAPKASARDPEAALGIPGDKTGFVSLGCAGELVLKFDDNALRDVAGPDLYVFEIGPDVEPTGLGVSTDGEDWVRVGRLSGGKSEIDLAPYADAGTEFRYVRLVDLKSACGGRTPGADIDAVGAIGSARRIALDSSVLFDSGTYQLKPKASAAIDKPLADIDNRTVASVVVAGYTDSVGDANDNQQLSEKRAGSVADYLVDQAGFSGNRVTRKAFGESQPVASNDTAAGRAENRRVELTVSDTATDEETPAAARTTILGLWKIKDHGTLELRRTEAGIEGDYSGGEGRVRGEFTSDTVFEGYWIKDKSGRSCNEKKAGSAHWGPLRVEFESTQRDVVKTQWRYCGDEKWRGRWPTGKRLL